ncbi:MAG: hypothetical protein PHP28_13490 [Actinomycetota bacterium]|nr:hypothetical protein [Actinomycetota bacterium]
MGIATCPACGKPWLFNLLLRWRGNGTIVTRISPAFRMVLVESALLEDIYQRIEAELGIPIREAVFEAERAAAATTIDNLLPDWLIKWVLRNRLVMHPASRFLQLLARTAGMADVHTVFYHVYRGSMARVRNEFSRELFAAIVVGAFESMEGVVYDHAWVEMGGDLYFLIMPAKGKPEIAHRLKPEIATPLPGQRKLEPCRRCGFPLALGHLRWDLTQAVIEDTRRDKRLSFVDGYAFSAVFRELVEELGEDIIPIIVEASSEYTLRSIQETGLLGGERRREEVYEDLLDLLPLHGKGNPVETDMAEDGLAVTVENPYSTYLLSGELLAIYEAVEGHPGTIAIYDEEQRVRITIKP